MNELGEGTSDPLQRSCLENPTDRGARWAAGHGVAKSQPRLSDFISLLSVVSVPFQGLLLPSMWVYRHYTEMVMAHQSLALSYRTKPFWGCDSEPRGSV